MPSLFCTSLLLAIAALQPLTAGAAAASAIDARGWLIKVDSKEAAQHHTRRALMAADEHGPAVLHAWFQDWQAYHGRTYESEAQRSAAFKAFEHNMRLVHDINANPNLTYWASGNKFSDLTWAEFTRHYLGKPTISNSTAAASAQQHVADATSVGKAGGRRQLLQSTFDWRNKGIVLPVRDQGNCSACYAFAAMHAIEAGYMIAQGLGTGVQFSIQQILDCYNLGGCSWGGAAEVMNTMTNSPLTLEMLYPLVSDYTGTQGSCRSNVVQSAESSRQVLEYASSSAGYDRFEMQSESTLIQAMQRNPLVHHFEVDVAFMTYAGGVYTAGSCTGNELNHALTSYGFNMNEGSWTFKNSWGPNWGEGGYVRIKMIGGTGTCGMYKWCVRPSMTFVQSLSASATTAAANIVDKVMSSTKATKGRR